MLCIVLIPNSSKLGSGFLPIVIRKHTDPLVLPIVGSFQGELHCSSPRLEVSHDEMSFLTKVNRPEPRSTKSLRVHETELVEVWTDVDFLDRFVTVTTNPSVRFALGEPVSPKADVLRDIRHCSLGRKK